MTYFQILVTWRVVIKYYGTVGFLAGFLSTGVLKHIQPSGLLQIAFYGWRKYNIIIIKGSVVRDISKYISNKYCPISQVYFQI